MATLIIPFEENTAALRTVPKILQNGIMPMAIEYIERELMERSAAQIGKEWPVNIGKFVLMVILTGDSRQEVYRIADRIDRIARENNALDTLVVDNRRKQDDILRIRSNVYLILKPHVLDLLDVAVPPSKIAEFVEKVKIISSECKVNLPVYGHAGDGNVHVHIMKEGLGDDWRQKYEQIKKEIFEVGRSLNGAITAEHGIGIQKIDDLHYSLSQEEIELMMAIKKIFDPKNILNPGKVLPENSSNPKSIK